MAIDTWNKRRSMMARGLPGEPDNLPTPSGSMTASDRHQRLFRYAKVAWASIVIVIGGNGIVFVGNKLKNLIVASMGIQNRIKATFEVE